MVRSTGVGAWLYFSPKRELATLKIGEFFLDAIFCFVETFVNGQIHSIPGFLKTGLARISTHSATWQFKQ